MADKKISQLTAATTPLAGTEVLPIVQSGSTVKVSAADITAGRNISASGLTLSGGTANGLLYLNASKAASAGSLLTFNETTVNLAGSTRTFRATADSGTAYTQLASDGVYATGTDLYLFAPTSKFVSFYANNAEQMRLDSTGLGIGTSSPAVKLDVAGASTTQVRVQMSGQADVRLLSDTGTGVTGTYSNHPFTIKANSADVLTATAAGNVGIGTPSPSVKLQVEGQIRTEAPTGGTAANWRLGTVHSVSPTSPNRTIEVDIGGTIYYLAAKTTND